MYKVEKRMQLKTSGTWNDILVTALTTQPGQWPRNVSSTGAWAMMRIERLIVADCGRLLVAPDCVQMISY